MPTLSQRTPSRQLLQQRPSLLQVGRINPLGEPAIERRQQRVGFVPLALLLNLSPPRRPSRAPLMALPSPILRGMSRLRRTALRLAPGHTGGAAAPRGGRGIA